jgi:hypothetical protein
MEDNIKMDLSEVGWESMDWIDVAQDRDRWRGFVNMVMNLRGIYWLAEDLLPSQKGLCSMEFSKCPERSVGYLS